jgi:AraC-like DNA-binding protein
MIALNHLAEGKTVQNVAGTLGYDSVSAFITMFRKALGKSPTQYFASLN